MSEDRLTVQDEGDLVLQEQKEPVEQIPGLAQIKQSPGGTPYANSRIRAVRGRLLTSDETLLYLNDGDLRGFINRFENSAYSSHYEKAILTTSGIDAVSLTLQMALRDTYYWVVSLSDRSYRKLLVALAAKWDIQDIKTIIRAKAAGVPPSEATASFVGVGVQIDSDSMQALARQKTLDDVVALALTWKLPYRKAFSRGLEAYYLRENIADFELALDHEYVKWAAKQFRGLGEGAKFAKDVFGQEVDKLNISTLIRMVDTEDEIEEPQTYFLEGGVHLNKKAFLRLMESEDIYTLIEEIGIPEYAQALSEGYDRYQLTGHQSEIERALEVRLTKETIRRGYNDILGFGVALSYLTAVENEVTNLNIIAHGLYRAVAPTIIKEDLILV